LLRFAQMISSQDSKGKKIVIHVLSGLRFGGTENLCLQIIKNSPSNVQNILLNLDANYLDMLPLFEQIANLKIINQYHLSKKTIAFILDLIPLFKQVHPQAILVYCFGLPHIYVGLAARLTGISSITVSAGNPAPIEVSMEKKWKTIILLSRFLQIPIYACSNVVHQSLEKLAKLPQGSFPITNGCDITEIAIRASHSRQKRVANSTTVIGMVARLNLIKDHQTLIKAFSILNKKFLDIELWLVGDGEEKETLVSLTEELGILRNVIFWGKRSDIPELLGQMDIYAFSTTENEGFGIALIEAMAAILPVLASDVPACREVLGNGQAGLLFNQKDPQALAQVLEELVSSPENRNHWGQQAYQYAVNYHSIQDCARKWYEVLLPEKINS